MRHLAQPQTTALEQFVTIAAPGPRGERTIAHVDSTTIEPRTRAHPRSYTAWAMGAAFGSYFCMYGFRKPFTAAAFAGSQVWGIEEKTLLVAAQVLGYALAKCLGIRVIAEMPASGRARGIVRLIAIAELALVLFCVSPRATGPVWMFVNGLALGMVFGLVVGFLEGRRLTEALTAGLCTSFILADGLTKSAGSWLLELGIGEHAMPALAGMLFLPPLLVSVWMLSCVPPPDHTDIALRSERPAMSPSDRAAFVSRHGLGLFLIVGAYFLVSIARGMRADFALEIWRGLGTAVVPSTFAISEIVVAVTVLVANGMSVLVVDNRRAFFGALALAFAGGVLMLAALAGLSLSWIDGFTFMALLGTGLYLPYVAVHTTIFERLIAMTRARVNLGFLMYVADSVSYLGLAALLIARGAFPSGSNFLWFFKVICTVIALLTCALLLMGWVHFARDSRSGARAGGGNQ
jgi:Family of unknown function (DUF5690)